jgi:hypothetical protein
LDESQVRWRGGRRLQLPPGKAAVSDTPVERADLVQGGHIAGLGEDDRVPVQSNTLAATRRESRSHGSDTLAMLISAAGSGSLADRSWAMCNNPGK